MATVQWNAANSNKLFRDLTSHDKESFQKSRRLHLLYFGCTK